MCVHAKAGCSESPGAKVTEACEFLMWVLGTKPRASRSALIQQTIFLAKILTSSKTET